jgi:hypothetical protein
MEFLFVTRMGWAQKRHKNGLVAKTPLIIEGSRCFCRTCDAERLFISANNPTCFPSTQLLVLG